MKSFLNVVQTYEVDDDTMHHDTGDQYGQEVDCVLYQENITHDIVNRVYGDQNQEPTLQTAIGAPVEPALVTELQMKKH